VSAFAYGGVAEITNVKDRFVYVKCPFCDCRHAHSVSSMGSDQIIAGCHQPNYPRMYAIPAKLKRSQR
jgi:hypothetical protein